MESKQKFSKEKIELIGENVDQLVSLDISGRDFIRIVYPPAREKHGRPLCLLAAEKLRDRVKHGDFVFITCGMLVYPLILSETNGPIGGAAIARALQVGLDAKPVLVVDQAAVELVKATCRGANLNVVNIDTLKKMRGP